MTGEDHDMDALIAALRSPALPSEQTGEAAAVTAMLDALPEGSRRHPNGRRSRRSIAIAAVTVASLGVGGLVAAGPGIFLPAADRPPGGGPNISDDSMSDASVAISEPERRPAGTQTTTTPTTAAVATADPEVPHSDAVASEETSTGECDGTHGDAVSDAATSTVPGDVRGVARSDCGRPDQSGGPDETSAPSAPGRSGDTPASTAPGQTGDTPASTAPGQTGDTPGDTAPRGSVDRSGVTDAQTANTATDRP